ncbi:MAG: hypothetical protein ACOYVF_00540, partial [Candidatus Zixiibacteriota bacterium]
MSLRLARTAKHLDRIVSKFTEYPPFVKVVETLLEQNRAHLAVTSLAGSSESVLLKNLHDRVQRLLVVVTHNSQTASDLYEDLQFLMAEKD